MNNEERILNAIEKMQSDIAAIREEIKSMRSQQADNEHVFKTFVHRPQVNTSIQDMINPAGSSKLDGKIETI
jgi:SMC interacting uncharacterized protein involved in chromosome segregation